MPDKIKRSLHSFHHTYKGKLYSNPSGFSQDRLSVERPEDSENLSGVKSKSPRKFNIDGLECTTPSAKKGVAIGDLKKIFKGLINVTLASDQEAFLSAKEEVNSRLALMGSTANGSNPTAADGQKAVLSSTAAGQYQNRTSTKDPSAQIAL